MVLSYLFTHPPTHPAIALPSLFLFSLLLLLLSFSAAAKTSSTPLPVVAFPAQQLNWIKLADCGELLRCLCHATKCCFYWEHCAKVSWMTLIRLIEIIRLGCIPSLLHAHILHFRSESVFENQNLPLRKRSQIIEIPNLIFR